MTEEAKDKPAPDWERIELDFRAGVLSLREIATPYKVTEGAIRKRAKKEDWQRDLKAKIQSKADELVRKEAVRSSVRANQVASEKDVVNANAKAIADVRLSHRTDIGEARELTSAMFKELRQSTDPETLERLKALGEIMANPDDHGRDKLSEMYQAIISLPERSKTLKLLVESMQKLVDMERTAFGLDDKGGDDKERGLSTLATAELKKLREQLANG